MSTRRIPVEGPGGYLTLRPGHPATAACAVRARGVAGELVQPRKSPAIRRVRGRRFWAFGQGSERGRFATLSHHGSVESRPTNVLRPASPVILPATDTVRRVIIIGLLVTVAMVALLAASQVIDLRRLRSPAPGVRLRLPRQRVRPRESAGAAGRRGGDRVARQSRGPASPGVVRAGGARCRPGHRPGLTTFNAKALAVPLACVFLLVCWLTWRDPRAARAVVWAGLILMAISLLLHKVGLAADGSPPATTPGPTRSPRGQARSELAGWMLLATGIVAGIRVVRPRSRPCRDRTGTLDDRTGVGRSATGRHALREPSVASEARPGAER